LDIPETFSLSLVLILKLNYG